MRILVSAVLVLCLAATLQAGEDNPFKKAKVGDWVEYKITTEVGGILADSDKVKLTVIAKDDKQVKVKAVVAKNKDLLQIFFIDPERTIDLTKPLDLTKPQRLFSSLQEGNPPSVEKGKTGSETIKSGGKEYKANWTQFKVTYKEQDYTADWKVWMSRDVPLYGVLKRESINKNKNFSIKILMELTGSGS